MNIYALLILAALAGEYLLGLTADLLNLRTLGAGLPTEFRGLYDEERYRKSQQYTAARLRFGIISSTVSLAAVLLFWLLGGFGRLDAVLRALSLSEVWTGVLYIGALALARSALSLPFSIYSTFVIEARFGFNRTSVRTFVGDLLKGLLLALLLGVPLVAVILWLFGTAGAAAWLYCWLVATGFILVVQFVAPAWIMPLFNTFTPLGPGELREAILGYARAVGFSLRDLYVIDGSKRSSKSNAFFTGFGRNKRIALFDTLVKNHPVEELVAVLAHEIGHYKRHHIRQGMIIGILHAGAMFFILSLFIGRQGLFDAFQVRDVSVYGGFVFFGMLFAPIELLLSLAMNALSRRNEFAADRYAAETTGTPEAMIGALKRLSVDNLSHLTPHPFYIFLHYSHPTVIDRIAAIKSRS
jgi:STE24 endopeptidase